MRIMAGLGVAVLLGACAAKPSTYYSLTAPLIHESSPITAAVDAQAEYGLRIGAVRVPAEVDRPQLMVRRDAAAADLALLNESLWAAPLADQVRGALAAQVSRALGVPDLSLMAAPEDLPVRQIDVQVTRFDLVYGGYAGLVAHWAEAAPNGPPSRLCQVAIRVPVDGTGVAPLVEAQRGAMGLLADAIVARLEPAAARPTDPAIQHEGCT